MKKINKNIFSIRLKNVEGYKLYSYLIMHDKYIFIIDSGSDKDDALKILNSINKIKNNQEIYIINTHYHYDHVNGNSYISKNVICSEKTGTILNLKPTLEVKNKPINFDYLIIFPSLGHTYDGICIYDNKSKYLFVGDNIGDDDIHIIPELENTKEEYKISVEEMIKYNPKRILSAHNYIKRKNFLFRILRKLS